MNIEKFDECYQKYLNKEYFYDNEETIDMLKAVVDLCNCDIKEQDLDIQFQNYTGKNGEYKTFLDFLVKQKNIDSKTFLLHLAFKTKKDDLYFKECLKKRNKQFFEEPGMNYYFITNRNRESSKKFVPLDVQLKELADYINQNVLNNED